MPRPSRALAIFLALFGLVRPHAKAQTSTTGDLEVARSGYEAALAAHPNDAAAQQGEVRVSEQFALNARVSGDRNAALVALLRAQPYAPANLKLLLDLGILEDEMHLFLDADKVLSQALRAGANDPNVLYAAGRVKLDLGQLVPAEEYLKSYLLQRPEDASARYALGRIYRQGLHFEQAAAEFNRSIALQPRQTEAYYQLGDTELAQGGYLDALKNFALALAGNPKHAGALVGTGTALFKQKQYALALAPLQQAVLADPLYQPGHYYLGLTLARLGRKEESGRELAEAERLAALDNHESSSRLRITEGPSP